METFSEVGQLVLGSLSGRRVLIRFGVIGQAGNGGVAISGAAIGGNAKEL